MLERYHCNAADVDEVVDDDAPSKNVYVQTIIALGAHRFATSIESTTKTSPHVLVDHDK
jgi:hypothetical protein